MSIELPPDRLLLTLSFLLIAGLILAGMAARARVPALLVFLAGGMLIGDDGLALFRFDDVELTQTIGVFALVVIVFEGGLSLPWERLRPVLGPASVLATLGVAITATVVAVVAYWTLDISRSTATLMGVVIASTDAAAVFAALKQTRISRRMSAVLEAEAGGNDPMAIALTIGVLEAWRADPTAVELIQFGLVQLVGGLVTGLVIGWGGATLFKKLRFIDRSLLPVLALGLAGLSYGVAARAGGSGILAVYVAGVVVRHLLPKASGAILEFHTGLATVAQLSLFLMLGLLVFPSELPGVTRDALWIAAALLLLARPVAIYATMPWFGWNGRELVFMSWAGLRGAVPIVLATFPRSAGHPDANTIFNAVFYVVLISTVVQGLSLDWLARSLGLARQQAAR